MKNLNGGGIPRKRPFGVYLLLLFLSILMLNAVPAGIMFMIKPDGSLLGMSPDWLAGGPFRTFLIPGILLFFFLGLFPLLAMAGLILKPPFDRAGKINLHRDMHWGWTYALYSGFITLTWILVQQMITRYFFLQPLIAGLAMGILIACLLPGVMRYFSRGNSR